MTSIKTLFQEAIAHLQSHPDSVFTLAINQKLSSFLVEFQQDLPKLSLFKELNDLIKKQEVSICLDNSLPNEEYIINLRKVQVEKIPKKFR